MSRNFSGCTQQALFGLAAVIALTTVTWGARPVLGQNLPGTLSAPVTGGTKSSIENSTGIKANDLFSSSLRVHMSPARKPCISASAYSRTQIVNPNIYENVVILSNNCSQPIKLTLCYFASTNCIMHTVSSYRRQEAILGYSPGSQEFRYQYREHFQ